MNRPIDYYRYQRRRMIKKKMKTYRYWYVAEHRPRGFFAKNKFHWPAGCRQIKTTPKAVTYSYGDRKHNWRPQDARRIACMNSQIEEFYREQ